MTLKILGLAMAVPFLLWLLFGLLPFIPSIVDVFGMGGLKLPAGIAISGLMLAAIGFEDY